jgi:5-methylthioribose kinase
LPDFDTLPSRKDQYEACRISLIIGQYLIMHRNEIHTIDALIDTIQTLTIQSRLLFKRADAR